MTNEYKDLTDEEVEELYYRACRAIRNMSELMHPSDRAHLIHRQRKLREEWIKRENGQ